MDWWRFGRDKADGRDWQRGWPYFVPVLGFCGLVWAVASAMSKLWLTSALSLTVGIVASLLGARLYRQKYRRWLAAGHSGYFILGLPRRRGR